MGRGATHVAWDAPMSARASVQSRAEAVQGTLLELYGPIPDSQG